MVEIIEQFYLTITYVIFFFIKMLTALTTSREVLQRITPYLKQAGPTCTIDLVERTSNAKITALETQHS